MEMNNFYDDGLIVLFLGEMSFEGFFCCLLFDL